MSQRRIYAAAIAVVLVGGASARADDILYFVDASTSTDRMAQALATFAGTHNVTSTNNTTTFINQLATGNYELAIFFEQSSNGANYDASIAALGAYIDGGGRGILTDWTRNNTHAAQFDASFTGGGTNKTSFTVTNPSLATGLSNPVSLTNPGWGVFSTEVNGANVAATFTGGQGAIVVGNGNRSIMNGFLGDTFTTGATGVQLYRNEINFVLSGGSVGNDAVVTPLPVAVWGGLALFGTVGASRLRRRRPKTV